MRKCANISQYMRRPLVIYDFAPGPSEWVYCIYEENFIFFFYQCALPFATDFDFFSSTSTFLHLRLMHLFFVTLHCCFLTIKKLFSPCALPHSLPPLLLSFVASLPNFNSYCMATAQYKLRLRKLRFFPWQSSIFFYHD
jgi:hypothetical protein